MTDPHFAYIAGSYAIGFVVIASLIAWTVADHMAQTRALAKVEARHGRRRRPERQ